MIVKNVTVTYLEFINAPEHWYQKGALKAYSIMPSQI
jgi:hypothetical protein